MYLVVIQSVASALYGIRLRWHVMRRTGEMEAVPVEASATLNAGNLASSPGVRLDRSRSVSTPSPGVRSSEGRAAPGRRHQQRQDRPFDRGPRAMGPVGVGRLQGQPGDPVLRADERVRSSCRSRAPAARRPWDTRDGFQAGAGCRPRARSSRRARSASVPVGTWWSAAWPGSSPASPRGCCPSAWRCPCRRTWKVEAGRGKVQQERRRRQ